jgi:hypothetical protein
MEIEKRVGHVGETPTRVPETVVLPKPRGFQLVSLLVVGIGNV